MGILSMFTGSMNGDGVDGVWGKCTNTEVYPRFVKSNSDGLPGVVGPGDLCEGVVGVSTRWRNEVEPDRARECVMLGRRRLIPRTVESEGRRGREGRRATNPGEQGDVWGEMGGGDPGWTAMAQLAMEVKVDDRRRIIVGEAGAAGLAFIVNYKCK